MGEGGKKPGVFVRAAGGAFHVPAGLFFLVRRPGLWGYAAFPALFGTVCLMGGIVLGALLGSWVNTHLAPPKGSLPDWLDLMVEVLLLVNSVGVGLTLGASVAFLGSSPLLELLSEKVEHAQTGATGGDRRMAILQTLLNSTYLLLMVPVAWVLSLVPLLGPLLAMLVAAHALVSQETSGPLGRRGLDFKAQRRWQREWWAEGLGFGLASLAFLAIPIVDILLIPAIVVGGTRLVVELSPPAPPVDPVESPSA
jgi:CysZ protein